MTQEVIGNAILDAAFKVHTKLGPGLLESVYEAAMAGELPKRGHQVERQKPIPVFYDGELLDEVGFRADLIVHSLVLVELKSVSNVTELFKKLDRSLSRSAAWGLFGPLHLPLPSRSGRKCVHAPATSRTNAASSRTGTPRDFAFSNFEPASSPATT
ncbi:MAG: GxxExxY protein [Opitutaceae bacterium]